MAKADRFTRTSDRVKNPICHAWVFRSVPGVGVKPLKSFVTREEAEAWAKDGEYVVSWVNESVNVKRK